MNLALRVDNGTSRETRTERVNTLVVRCSRGTWRKKYGDIAPVESSQVWS
jgi:hypothetical protein